MDERIFREKLRKARKGMGLSQEAMAEKLGLDRNTYGNIERGKTRLIYDHLGSILEILGISIEELITEGQPEPRKNDAVLSDVCEQYETRLDAALKENSALRSRISELEDIIRDKTEIISYQKARISSLESPEK